MTLLSTPSEAKDTFDFALEEIIKENELNKKIKLSDILDSKSISSDYLNQLEKIGSRLIDNKKTIWLLYDSNTNKYYKWISIN